MENRKCYECGQEVEIKTNTLTGNEPVCMVCGQRLDGK
jgi:hypothetical protein